ncbi:sigma-70 family RNA polymerase sigma factor [Tibeticola sp.]|jgi:RNA polymerase sigma-70 factor (ECF subfamily)|uniref:sigma-70 family RNA polymerase sigma factor n=1 Tax=Tibeticola sp. TaxID=2005368 RepID=UPI0025858C1E|nr:sigma-70 family RNA polymerase sigma factor [Tibeticola sp.]MCI4441751.1 sigma-70 family RNA polymerase sigma factor [Tibeticola sp.]
MRDEADNFLLERARAGDAQAIEALLERHQAQVYRFGMKMCRDPEDAKDVLQDTLLSMARGVRDFRGASSISTWLYTIARSFCIKKRRRSKFAPEEERSLDTEMIAEGRQLADPAQSPDEVLAGKQVEHALEQAIRSLEPMYREVLLLRDVEGLTAPEVAEVLGVSIQAVKSRLHRARLSVRAQVAPMLGISTDGAAANGTCPDVLTLFSQHLEEEISADICAEMERHLQACDRCRSACDSLKRTLALCRTTGPTVQVPNSVQASVKVALRNFLAENA